MSDKLQNLLEIAKLVLPPIDALIKDDDGKQMAKDVAYIVETVIGHIDPEDRKKAVQQNPTLQAKLKIKIEEAANRQAETENRADEAKRNDELEAKRRELAHEQQIHEEELEEFQKVLKSTESARVHANKAASSEHWWVAGINPLLSIIIVAAFFVFLALIANNPIGEKVFINAETSEIIASDKISVQEDGTFKDSNGKLVVQKVTGNTLEIFYIAFGAMATAFVTVVGFHFGSSSGSKRKTKLQRLYGTRGILSKATVATVGQRTLTSPLDKSLDLHGNNSHPFERFWRDHLSHIEHFDWRELLEKGASNTGVGLNTDPPRDLYQNVIPLVNTLDQIRKELGAPVQLLSVYRNPAYNRHVGGASSSRHMSFDAADFRVLGGGAGNSTNWSNIAKRLRQKGVFKGGIGVYSSFVHIDTRGNNDKLGKNADWDKR